MPLLTLVAATSFACASPSHHDGDAIRCAGEGKAMRLYGIDAPEMPGACRPGRDCTPGDPYAARDFLRFLTRGRNVTCEQRDIDNYGRRVVRCAADGEDISCTMIAAGHAVERYARLDCAGTGDFADAENARTTPAQRLPYVPQDIPTPAVSSPGAIATGTAPVQFAPVPRVAPPRGLWIAGLVWLVFINIAAYWAFAIDKDRSIAAPSRPVRRVPESTLLALAALGGSAGAITAQQTLRHKTIKQPFATRLLMIAGLQIGLVLGAAVLLL